MKKQNRIADLPLNADYYLAPDAHPDTLLDDANLWLGYAHGMTRALSDALIEGETMVHTDLADALQGVAALMLMGRCCAELAHRRIGKDISCVK